MIVTEIGGIDTGQGLVTTLGLGLGQGHLRVIAEGALYCLASALCFLKSLQSYLSLSY